MACSWLGVSRLSVWRSEMNQQWPGELRFVINTIAQIEPVEQGIEVRGICSRRLFVVSSPGHACTPEQRATADRGHRRLASLTLTLPPAAEITVRVGRVVEEPGDSASRCLRRQH